MKIDKSADQFIKRIESDEKLRGPDGCPCDKEQTTPTLLTYLIEDT